MALIGNVNDMNIDLFKNGANFNLSGWSVEIQQKEENFDVEF